MLPLFNNTTYLDRIPIRVSTQAVRHTDYFHFHRRIQLCFVLSGKLKHTICGKEYIQQAGSCAFLLPYMPHIIDSSESDDTPIIAHIWFHEDFLKDRGYIFSSYGEWANFNGYKIPVVSDFSDHGDTPIQVMHELINEFAQEKKLSFKKMAHLTAELFSLACTEPITSKEDALFKKQLDGIDSAINYMEEHFSEKLSLDDLCKIAGMSRRSFTSHFKRITNLTPLQYILSIRLQTAFKLIAETDMLFDEVAHSTGLGNHSNLARVFIKNLGVTPSRFAEDYIRNTSHSHTFSTESRYRWLTEL
ncbi:MAG: helix-turn-helix domain-containing protein [Oscillospiraceae bacterium]|nr:helix-turn-helix domain-containing protein [Oscillospiraceae bacterium]MBQ9986389.1 helix-turn-helix domain-containing protein [Oscillospiraceae bacterium]